MILGQFKMGEHQAKWMDHIHSKILFSGSPGPVPQRTSTRTTGRRRISSAPGLINFLVAELLAPGLMQLFDYRFQV